MKLRKWAAGTLAACMVMGSVFGQTAWASETDGYDEELIPFEEQAEETVEMLSEDEDDSLQVEIEDIDTEDIDTESIDIEDTDNEDMELELDIAEESTEDLSTEGVTPLSAEGLTPVEVAEPETIVGFEALDSADRRVDFFYDMKPSQEEAAASMPETIKVYLQGEKEAREVEVSWVCTESDYEETDDYLYQFIPVFDENDYVVDSAIEMSTDAPYVMLYLNPDQVQSMTVTKDYGANEKALFDFLVSSMGLNNAGACGVLANVQCESWFDTTACGDGGTSYGICQWHNGRYSRLIEFCQNKGYDYKSITGQMNYLKYELENYYSDTLSLLKGVSNTADGAFDAGYYWCKYFEVPADTEYNARKRGTLAEDTYWPEYRNVSAGGSSSGSEVDLPKITSVTNLDYGIQIKWSEKDYADKYTLYRKQSGGSWKALTTTTGTSYKDTSVYAGTKYAYAVKPVASGKNYSKSASKCIYRVRRTSITQVSRLTYGNYIKWESADGASTYRVYRKQSGSSWSYIGESDGLSFVDRYANHRVKYAYRIRGVRGKSVAAASKAKGLKTSLKFSRVKTTEQINARTKPGYSGSIARSLSKNTIVNAVKKSGIVVDGINWYRVYYSGSYYFVCASYLAKP